jgi:hypothetical protein
VRASPQVKLLSKETEVQSQAQAQAVEALKASEDLCQHTHTQLQHRHWEIKDITAVKDARCVCVSYHVDLELFMPTLFPIVSHVLDNM